MATTLYGYWRSSTAYRVRCALNLKGIQYDQVAVHLVKDGGEQHGADHKARNPFELVPALDIDGHMLIESPAILEYLEETRPQRALLPVDEDERALVRAFCSHIACNIHPICNLRVLQHLKTKGFDDAAIKDWNAHWIDNGLQSLEEMISAGSKGSWLFGETPGWAEVYLVPQMYNARRWGADLSKCPRLVAADEQARQIKPFVDAAPENQPDAV